MIITNINIVNFRGLQSISLNTASRINVIVGPNAIGKSTLLESLRLVKAVLAPKSELDAQQTLTSLGALNPGNQIIGGSGLRLESLASTPADNVVIEVKLLLDDNDIASLKGNIDQLTMMVLRAQTLSYGLDSSSLVFTQFLSTEQGRNAFISVKSNVTDRVNTISGNTPVSLSLTIDAATRSMRGSDIIDQNSIAILDRQLPANMTNFSLFPADRALPQGEQPIQLGSADVQQQVMSHIANPGLKYNRIKQVLLQTLLQTDAGRERIIDEVNLIFDQLLPGKKFAGVRINNIGFLAVQVQDTATGRIFDMDFMSSGEKGLLLTFLFVRLTVARGGIVLLDEPELHLNSAVQERIINFIDKFCVQELRIQIFICTHSPEIVREAFARPGCSLFHLRSGRDLTPVLPEDYTELFEIVARLGNTTADVLFNRGNLYVEGIDDSEIIKVGFPDLTNGYKISTLGGRGDVEKEAPALKRQEEMGKLTKPQVFVLDNDGRPLTFENGQFIKVIQWSRHCIENYLLNEVILYDAVVQNSRENPGSRGEFVTILRELALSQAEGRATREAYAAEEFISLGLRNEDIRGKTVDQTAAILAERIWDAHNQILGFKKDAWVAAFLYNVAVKKKAIEDQLQSNWKELCDGKKLIGDLYARFSIRKDKREFKKDVMKRMRESETDEWRVIRDILSEALIA